MLVFGRRPGESVVIGDVLVTVLSVAGGRMRLGIEAPPHVSITRGEVAGAFDNFRTKHAVVSLDFDDEAGVAPFQETSATA